MMLEDLLDNRHPHASFHDSLINRLNTDYVAGTVVFEMDLAIGSPDAHSSEERNKRTGGILTFYGVYFFILELPDSNYGFKRNNRLWVADDGPMAVKQFQYLSDQLERLPQDAKTRYFFINDWNSFICIAFDNAEFRWMN